ncbi:MAG: type IX secretion system membrane protein PorP/SprF [Bacteroidota bacterium]
MGKNKVSFIICNKWLIIFLVTLVSTNTLNAQPAPCNPISYRIFNPFVFNPAIAGSKDFSTAGLIISNYGKSNAQLATINTRLSKTRNEYFTSPSNPEFTNIGLGGYFFNELDDPTHNIGIGATGSYHLQLTKDALSYFSVGITAKYILNMYAGNTELENPSINTYINNFDAGMYYYNPSFYAGISATNILDRLENPDSLGIYNIPITRRYFFYGGAKIILSRYHNILLEPSLIITSGDSIPDKIIEIFKPGLKLYAGDFCIGTYLNDFNKISFFGQYKYPRTYLGAYFELAYKEPYYKQPLLVEFALGINISAVKYGTSRSYHW